MGRLNWDTFPKTGSSWLACSLELAYPASEIVWGGHRKTTLKKESNVITVVRNPLDSVSSAMVFFSKTDVEGLLDWYCRFTQEIIDSKHRIFATQFEDLISEPFKVVQAYAKRFELETPKFFTQEMLMEISKKTYPHHLPEPLTKERQEANLEVKKSSMLDKANTIYENAKAVCWSIA